MPGKHDQWKMRRMSINNEMAKQYSARKILSSAWVIPKFNNNYPITEGMILWNQRTISMHGNQLIDLTHFLYYSIYWSALVELLCTSSPISTASTLPNIAVLVPDSFDQASVVLIIFWQTIYSFMTRILMNIYAWTHFQLITLTVHLMD